MAYRVRVRNFQSLKDVDLEIDGLTIVTGTNNAGKSALLRALHGAFANARGSDFVRHGSPHASVGVKFEDGSEFVWEKGDKVNRYKVGDLVLEKVAHGAPQEVRNLGVRSIQASKREYWPQVSSQFDDIFLLGEPGSVMAEAVADVDRVGLLTRALRLSEADTRQANSERRIRRKDLKEVTARRKVLEKLDALNERFKALEERQKACQALEKKLQVARAAQTKMKQLKSILSRLGGLDKIGQELGRLGVTDLETALAKRRSLLRVQEQWVSAVRQKKEARVLTASSVAVLEDIESRLGEVSTTKVDVLKSLREALQKAEKRVQEEELREKKAHANARLQLQALEEYIATAPPCGECGRPLSEDLIEGLR